VAGRDVNIAVVVRTWRPVRAVRRIAGGSGERFWLRCESIGFLEVFGDDGGGFARSDAAKVAIIINEVTEVVGESSGRGLSVLAGGQPEGGWRRR